MARGILGLSLLLGVIMTLEASHFRGGQLTWKPEPGNPLSVALSLRLSWRRDVMFPTCDQNVIRLGNYTEDPNPDEDWNVVCISGCSGNVMGSKIQCTDYSVSENWMVGERQDFYTFPAPAGVYEIEYDGLAWINSLYKGGGGNWTLRSTIDLRPRPDNGRINTPPSFSTQPIVRINNNCKGERVIRINPTDVDGDRVRCRWAQGNECADVCNGFPIAVLDQDTCELRVQSGDVTAQWYAVAIMVEDFRSGSFGALSKTPVQFLVNGYTGNACSAPTFGSSTPPDGTVFHYDSNCPGAFQLNITAAPGSITSSIREINVVARRGIIKSNVIPLNNALRESYVTLSWNPPNQDTVETISVVAVDQNGVSSPQRSFVVRVYKDSTTMPNQCKGTTNCQYCGSQPSAVLSCMSKCLCPTP